MISVCLPVYRYDVRPLVEALLREANALAAGIELLVYDDASPDDGDWGKDILRENTALRYRELTENLGRAAIRNRLVQDAKNPYVLLLDADAGLPPRFLANYLQKIHAVPLHDQDRLVVVGGRRYAPGPPQDFRLHLHWWYGTRRESRVDPTDWQNFHSNNFLASRDLLLAYPFPEDFSGYGHEDTLWGQQLQRHGLPLLAVPNPVVHLGLEPAAVFLSKQQEALANLHRLRNQTLHPEGLRDFRLRTRLTDFADRYPRLTRLLAHCPEAGLRHYLTHTTRPGLYALDLLKLRWWQQLTSREHGT
ncbi:glycosyltransferase family 2 protein [Neolewinella lacunae]|uniref:Glycosyltransferase family 2 protein n=1 Tax=Neolewinella lacunae TaxID=1517758 RepID=A0A923TAA4_9BACT|nr:glycosyltransferase family 2 protein [Neolewinella lacunae]MBC6995953.1 glycosyltransferase family 2 protein [Neolewinella lacunae]MDN3635203.1 glycosyltransferase family 2 protein [Neolewinella lacunae]